jgi:hypothetical protein
VAEWVVESTTSAWNFPVLTKMNYYDWAALMRVMLQARGLWDAVSAGTSEDHMALEVITKAVPPEMLGSIASKPSAKAAWEAITLRNVDIDRVHKAKASTLKHEFDALTFNDGETMDDFGARIGQITNQLVVLGFDYMEEEVVQWFLLALPPKFEQIATSIEPLLNLETISVNELISRLKASEERINRNGGNTVAALNLTKDKLVARLPSCLKVSGNSRSDRSKEESSSNNNKRGRGHGRGHGSSGRGAGGHGGDDNAGGHDGDTADRGGGGTGGDITGDECHYCDKKGHWARECYKKKRDEEAHIAVHGKRNDHQVTRCSTIPQGGATH